MAEEKVGITKSDLAEIVAAAIAAARQPVVTKAEEAALVVAQQQRQEQAQSVREEIAQKRAIQKICSHKHAKTGDSHCVYITNENYILCQKNQCKIRSGVAPKGYQGGDIFDTDMFNRIFQEIGQNDLFE